MYNSFENLMLHKWNEISKDTYDIVEEQVVNKGAMLLNFLDHLTEECFMFWPIILQ